MVRAPQLSRATELAQAKLLTSGLTLTDAKHLNICLLTPVQTKKLYARWPIHSLKFDYLGPNGAPLLPAPHFPSAYRLRRLEALPSTFGEVEKDHKYHSPVGVPLAVYFPHLPTVDWAAIVADPSTPLIITEGELKAACATKHGFPCVGLGGVSSYSAKGTLDEDWLPTLNLITWVGRAVYVAYDADYRTNEHVAAAAWCLMQQLSKRGSLPYLVELPLLQPTQKLGLDDFLIEFGADALAARLQTARHFTDASLLHHLNGHYAYVRDLARVYDQRTGQLIEPSVFKDTHFTEVLHERQLTKEGTVKVAPIKVGKAWLGWAPRREVAKLVYKPGQPTLLKLNCDHRPALNVWTGWGTAPTAGDVGPFLQLLRHLLHYDETAIHWFLQWCAYPLQYPGTKLFSAVALYGGQGVGKSLIGETLGGIYGENFAVIGSDDLHSAFNNWAERKQFVLGDEITGSDRRADNDTLKRLITQTMIRINEKYIKAYTIDDCVNYLFTTNHCDAFFLEDDDRRFAVYEVAQTPFDEEFFKDYTLWRSTTGTAALFYYLLHEVDVSDFNPTGAAPQTMAKDRMVADAMSDLGTWVRDLLADPDTCLTLGEVPLKSDLYTSKELLRLYDPDERGRVTANGLARELKRAKITQLHDGRPIRVPGRPLARYFAVRHRELWLLASLEEIQQHLLETSNHTSRAQKF